MSPPNAEAGVGVGRVAQKGASHQLCPEGTYDLPFALPICLRFN